MQDLRAQFEHELSLAESARAQGLEGRARVCARRAAGLAARAFLEKRAEPVPSHNALALLNLLASRPDLPADAHQVLRNLLMRVTPNYQLPVDVDLVAEARRLASLLDH